MCWCNRELYNASHFRDPLERPETVDRRVGARVYGLASGCLGRQRFLLVIGRLCGRQYFYSSRDSFVCIETSLGSRPAFKPRKTHTALSKFVLYICMQIFSNSTPAVHVGTPTLQTRVRSIVCLNPMSLTVRMSDVLAADSETEDPKQLIGVAERPNPQERASPRDSKRKEAPVSEMDKLRKKTGASDRRGVGKAAAEKAITEERTADSSTGEESSSAPPSSPSVSKGKRTVSGVSASSGSGGQTHSVKSDSEVLQVCGNGDLVASGEDGELCSGLCTIHTIYVVSSMATV